MNRLSGNICLTLMMTVLFSCQQDSYKAGFEKDYGQNTFNLVKKSKKIYFFEIDPYYEDSVAVERVDNYAIIGEKTPVNKENKKIFQSMLTSYDKYNKEGLNWACRFTPTFGFEINKKGQVGYLLISPKCNKARFWIKNKEERYFIDYSLLIKDIESIFNR